MTARASPENDDESCSEKSLVEVSAHKKSIFMQYAKIFRVVFGRWLPMCSHLQEQRNKELEELILPSNEDWRQGVYYRLVELQRECDAEVATKREEMKSAEKAETKESKTWEWGAGARGYPLRAKVNRRQESAASLTVIRGLGGSMTEACVQPGWRINDILLAAKVLQKDQPPPTYSDEAEMRRVFGLVYDVLRYKNILNRILEDVGFWQRNSAIKDREKIVWLLLYDMQGRKFARRGEISAVEERERIFKAVGLMDIENSLLESKTHLAASVSRLRIGGSALNLGWVNTFKLNSKNEFLEEMSKLNFVFCEDCEATELDEADYVFDPLCPKIVNLHDRAREKLAVSSLVRDHRFVFLERSLCLGAAALAQAIRVGRLCGPIVLTHSVAPRHTGYLAGLLADIEDAGRLLAFGAGDRRYEYETYLKSLGVTLQRCRIFSEKYASPPPSAELERATVVLAVPPCSYTGVRDIVDLAVARGGDADLLESLTSARSTDNDETKQPRPRALLADQLATLKYALTRPNVQFLIYEAHTILPSETTEMIKQVVDYANRMAMEKYIREHPPKKKAPPKEEKGSKAEKLEKSGKTDQSQEEDEASITISADITVPDSDLFEVGSIDDIYGESSSRMVDPGCFLAVIRRKEMMQFDSLFMIKVAESKGLFGDPNEQQKPKRDPVVLPARRPSQINRKELKRAKIEIDRIMAPTYSSLLRTTREDQACPRHKRHDVWKEKIWMTQIPRNHEAGKDSGRVSSRGNLVKSWQRQKESAKRLSVPSRVRTIHKKELEMIFPLHTVETMPSRAESCASSPRRVLKHEEKFSTLADLLSIAPLKGHEWKQTVPSSTALRSPALARALQRIPLENDGEERDKENLYERLRTFQQRISWRKTSLFHQPDGSVGYARLPFRHRLEAVAERLQEYSHLLCASPNSTLELDLDDSPDC